MRLLAKFLLFIAAILFLYYGISLAIYLLDALSKGTSIQDIAVPNFFSFEQLWNFSPELALNIKKIIVITILVILIVMFIYIFLGYNFFYWSSIKQNKFEKLNFHHFQNYFERKRGLYRLSYNSKGKITESTLEHLIETIFYPLYKFQNYLMRYFLKPRYRFWNFRTKKRN